MSRHHPPSQSGHHGQLYPSPNCLAVAIFLFCSLSYFATSYADSGGSSNGEEQVTVRGVAGQSASLPCYIDETNCGDIYFLTWSKLEKDDRWSRIYVYSDDNVNKPLSNLAGRARFSMQKPKAQLVINSLKLSDESLYKCDVTYVSGKCPSLTFVQLQIIAKPVRSWIEHEGDHLQSGHHLSLTEGDFLKLACSVLGGRPQPNIVWRSVDSRGHQTLLKKWTESNSVLGSTSNDLSSISSAASEADSPTTTTLILTKKLTRDDLGVNIECHVEHETITNNLLDSSVAIDVSVGIKTMEIIGPSTSIREGDVAVIECVAYGSKPAAEIVWRNGSKIIDGRSTRTMEEPNVDGITVNTRSKLEIVVSHQDHLNPITCEAANVAMRTPINKSTEISVLFAPIVEMEPRHGVTVNESTSMVSIFCTFRANPHVLLENETVWFKDGRMLDTSDASHYSSYFVEYPILTIKNVSRNDTGQYYCSIANQLGAGVSESAVHLNVLYPPTVHLQVHPSPSPDYLIKESDNLRMICDIVDGNPRNASRMRWLKNNGETVSELDSETGTHKELTWLNIGRSLTGNYTCQAISDAGISEPSNEVAIVVNYPPSKAIIRLVNEPYPVKGKNLTLECVVSDPGRPSDKTEFHWENSDGIIFESRQSTLRIPNLRLVNRGNISCSAVNEVGFGPRGNFELIPYAPPQFINPLPATIGVNENFRSLSVTSESQRQNNADTYHYDYVPESVSGSHGLRQDSRGNTLSVYCRVECFPLCDITWLRNDQPIDNSTGEYEITQSTLPEEFLLNRFSSVVSILTWNMSAMGKLDRVRDSGVVYSCVSSHNPVGSSVRSNTNFQVEYAPENLRVSSTRVDVIENEMLPELRCDSDSLPPASYRWVSNSFYDKFSGVIAESPILALNRTIGRDMAGTYTCIAANRHGERRIDLQVNVLYRPACTIYESRTGKDNQDVVLICEVTFANPNTGLEFDWILNGTHLNDSYVRDISIQEGLKSKIIIPSMEDDTSLFGTWTCSVRNTVGRTEPNCTIFVDAPLVVPEWSALNDKSILIISTIIVAIIFVFAVVLLFLVYMMRLRRHKSEKEKRENPDGSRSPTPSSSTSRISSNQNDIISTKSQASSKKATDTERLSSSNSSALGTASSGEMYENMPFHRKPNCLSHLNGTASYYHSNGQHSLAALHHSSSIHTGSPLLPPTYDNTTSKLTNDFRRTQSARFNSNQPFGKDMDDVLYADIYEDVKSGKMADPRIRPPLPPKPGLQVSKPKLPPKRSPPTSSKHKSA